MILFAALACSSGPFLLVLDCLPEEVVVAPDEAPLGFSADDAVAWYGDADTLDIEWSGRHSRTPPHDVIEITLGPLSGEVVLVTNVPARPEVPAARCAAQDQLRFARAAAFATADGGVAGDGTVEFTLGALALDDAATVQGRAPDVTLDDARWLEVDRALDGDLAPPDAIALHVYRSERYASAAITAEGRNYSVSVWKCDEQLAPDCLDWR